MGIYDRDYLKSEQKGFTLGGDRMMVTNLMLLNGAVYVAQLLIPDLTDKLGLSRELFSTGVLSHPWWILNLVSYGFAHATNDLMHIAFNMFGLWFFGRDIELKYGRREFLALYLTTIVFAGLVWVGVGRLAGDGGLMIGASGGVVGVMVLYVLNFPKRVLYIWGVLPLPAWALGAFWLLGDVSGVVRRTDNVAYVAHLAGGAYGLIYFQTGWSALRLLPRNFSLKSLKPKPRLRVHDPDEYEEEVGQQVDDILRKIQEQGQDSLTAKERRTLEEASRRYQQKHR